jgi:hypothetical protein
MFNAQTAKQEYNHPNFGEGASAVELTFDGVFPIIKEYQPGGHHAASVQEQPKDNGGWTTRKHTSNENDALIVNSEGYRVEMGAGEPKVFLNDVQVFPV